MSISLLIWISLLLLFRVTWDGLYYKSVYVLHSFSVVGILYLNFPFNLLLVKYIESVFLWFFEFVVVAGIPVINYVGIKHLNTIPTEANLFK